MRSSEYNSESLVKRKAISIRDLPDSGQELADVDMLVHIHKILDRGRHRLCGSADNLLRLRMKHTRAEKTILLLYF